MKELEQQLASLQTKLSATEAQVQRLTDLSERDARDKKLAKDTIRKHIQTEQELQKQLQAEQQSLAQLQVDNRAKKEHLALLQRQKATLASKVQQLEESVTSQQRELSELQGALQIAKDQKQEVQQRLEAERSRAESLQEQLNATVSAADETESVSQQLTVVEQRCKDLEAANNTANEEAAKLRMELGALRVQLEEQQTQNQTHEAKIAELTSEKQLQGNAKNTSSRNDDKEMSHLSLMTCANNNCRNGCRHTTDEDDAVGVAAEQSDQREQTHAHTCATAAAASQ